MDCGTKTEDTPGRRFLPGIPPIDVVLRDCWAVRSEIVRNATDAVYDGRLLLSVCDATVDFRNIFCGGLLQGYPRSVLYD